MAKIAIMDTIDRGSFMKTMSARDAKNAFGLLMDTARAEPVAIEKHGRRVVVVLSIEEFERMKMGERLKPKTAHQRKT
jgi:prevent-host-death family protein